jgi:hypothetical protein
MNYLVVRNEDGLVVNVIVWDGVTPYEHADSTLMPCSDDPGVWIGWRRVGDEWVAPPEPEPEPQQEA